MKFQNTIDFIVQELSELNSILKTRHCATLWQYFLKTHIEKLRRTTSWVLLEWTTLPDVDAGVSYSAMPNPVFFRYFLTSSEIIQLAVMLYVRFLLSLRKVEDLLHERGVDVSYESVRYWWYKFGSQFASEIKKRRAGGLQSSNWRWHLDEVFVKINGERHYLWRAVDHEGGVLESYVTKKRDKKAALKFMKKAMRRYGSPNEIVTDKLRSYSAAAKKLSCADKQITERWANNRVENSHLPFWRRERAMLRFRRIHSLEKFASIHASFYNLLNSKRSLLKRNTFKLNRDAALNGWRSLIIS